MLSLFLGKWQANIIVISYDYTFYFPRCFYKTGI